MEKGCKIARKEFIKYLVANNIYDKFLYYTAWTKHDIGCNITNHLSGFWRKDYCGDIIDYSFTWSATIEGHDFWFKKDSEWKEYVYNNLSI